MIISGLPDNTPQQQLAVEESAAIHGRCPILLSAVDQHSGLGILENPATSMTWDDPLMYHWVQAVAPYAAQACACMFDRDWLKAWMFVSNRPGIFAVARSCPHLPGSHQQIAGVRLPDGTFMSRITAEYPPELARALATIISQYVTTGSGEVPLEQWQQLLPPRLQWPVLMNRVEDGGGLPSTAFHMTKCIADPLVKLRSRWFKRLSDTRHCLKNTAALISGCREPPLSQQQLQPYVEDLLESLGCPPGDHLLHTPPGQPFRLHLWHRLAVFLGDPDADFLLSLEKGVPLGVNTDLIPSPAWPSHEGVVTDPTPLYLDCTDSWNSAQDHRKSWMLDS